MFYVQRKDAGYGNWQVWGSAGSEYSATRYADSSKENYPRSQFRVIDERGLVRYIV